MTTLKQKKANRKNAMHSTGAGTPEGKAIVSQNALKHGIFAKDLFISINNNNENPDDFQTIYNNLLDCLNPLNQLEFLLVEKIAVDFWRMRRVLRFEAKAIIDIQT